MVEETIFQHWIFTRFALPFLLVFFIVFAILEKTKLLGDDKKQLNALLAFVVGLVFVGAVYPTEVVGNLILFLTVALVVVFIVLLLWGFVFGSFKKDEGFTPEKWMKWVLGIVIGIAVVVAVLWATGIGMEEINDFFNNLFSGQDWSSTFWINVAFIVVVAIALALILKKSSD